MKLTDHEWSMIYGCLLIRARSIRDSAQKNRDFLFSIGVEAEKYEALAKKIKERDSCST